MSPPVTRATFVGVLDEHGSYFSARKPRDDGDTRGIGSQLPARFTTLIARRAHIRHLRQRVKITHTDTGSQHQSNQRIEHSQYGGLHSGLEGFTEQSAPRRTESGPVMQTSPGPQ